MKEEFNYLKINKDNINKVDILFTKTNDEYDNLLINNIIIIPLWNASANNSVLECIEMNIPAFITRLPSTEEYLGKDYPMFYENIKDVEFIINNNNLLFLLYEKTYFYLKNINKKELDYNYFNSELLKIIN